jgi:hypothetical protein
MHCVGTLEASLMELLLGIEQIKQSARAKFDILFTI